MTRAMRMEWPQLDTAVTAILEDGKNPALCDDVWNHLPMEAVQEHGVVTGKIIYCWVPMISVAPAPFIVNHTDATPGQVHYSQATGNKIIVNYGKCSEDLGAPVLAKVVTEDLPKLEKVGLKMWEVEYITKEVIVVKFSKKED